MAKQANLPQESSGSALESILNEIEASTLKAGKRKEEEEESISDIILTEKVDDKLISKEFFEHNVRNLGMFMTENQVIEYVKESPAVNIPLLGFAYSRASKTTEYLPFYSSFLRLDPYTPYYLFGKDNENHFKSVVAASSGVMDIGKVYHQFCSACIDKGYYNLLFMTKLGEDNDRSKESLRTNMVGRFDQYVNGTGFITPYMCKSFASPTFDKANMSEVILHTKRLNVWRTYNVPRVGNLTANLFFLGCSDNVNGNNIITPIYCMVFKKEDLAFIRACIITNTPIPLSKLSLLVNPDAMKTGMKKVIDQQVIGPLKRAGINVIGNTTIINSLFETNKLPKFKSIAERNRWMDRFSVDFINGERGKVGAPLIQVTSQEVRQVDKPDGKEKFSLELGTDSLVKDMAGHFQEMVDELF